MNKDQFAYLNETIAALESERDKLQSQRIDDALTIQGLLNTLATERDAFGKKEAELKALLKNIPEQCNRLNEENNKLKEKLDLAIGLSVEQTFKTDRWRTLAKELAEALKPLMNDPEYFVAVEALTAFDAVQKERGA